MTETQDKALRRIAELREQCNLEQKAKAHLEDVLRNEVEERDHLIETLKTKVCAHNEDFSGAPGVFAGEWSRIKILNVNLKCWTREPIKKIIWLTQVLRKKFRTRNELTDSNFSC